MEEPVPSQSYAYEMKLFAERWSKPLPYVEVDERDQENEDGKQGGGDVSYM